MLHTTAHLAVYNARNLTSLAVARGLDIRDTARLFAMVYTAQSDAAIAGFEAKYFYRTWRPRADGLLPSARLMPNTRARRVIRSAMPLRGRR